MTEHLPETISRLYTDPGEYVDSDYPAVEAFARAAAPAGAGAPTCNMSTTTAPITTSRPNS